MREPRLRCLLPPIREPNWRKWVKIPNAELWEVVALACALDPSPLAQWIHHRIVTTEELTKFQDRVKEAVAALEIHGGTLPALSHETENAHARVEFGNFRIWATEAGWDIPSDFPEFIANRVKIESPIEREIRLFSLIKAELAKGITLKQALYKVASHEPSQRQEAQKGEKISTETLRKIYYRRKKRLSLTN